MKFFKFCLLPVLILVAIPIAIGSFMAEEWEVEVSVTVSAPAEKIHPLVEEPARWVEWNLFVGDSSEELSCSGEAKGTGAVASMTEDELAVRWEITDSDPARGVWFTKGVGDSVETKSSITYAPSGERTVVTWRDRGSLGSSPIMKLFVPLVRRGLEGTCRESLEKLREAVEREAVTPPQ